MDYQFENLSPERFQQFCQALLVKEFPNVQCLPVGQPDGGRDALVYLSFRKSTEEFIVFQVKFVRKPQAETNPHRWLIEIIEEEAPKLEKMIPKGALRYYLLTNVPGTAHPDVGSIDRVNKLLNDSLEIPSQCWWRDDLNRRLDNAWSLKWVYPELMTGLDMLHYVLESGLSEDKERRTSAIKSFVRTQYENDQEVRFKQIELQNKLLDLFIDVPARYISSREDRKHLPIIQFIAHSSGEKSDTHLNEYSVSAEDSPTMGAATLFLHPLAQEHIPQSVLEGAPGQGKSTITQFICQVHRMYILGEMSALASLPNHLRPTSIRIPFKVDLRDLATWLNKEDPFSSEDSKLPPENWHKSLEAFLAFQVKTLSGGFEFSVADLHAVAKISAFLLVLDGLDEVADISRRREIVAEVKAGVNRHRESCASLQVIVTSRPAAFANSPGFPENSYPRYELVSITRSLIDEYAKRWCKAKRLNSRDTADVKRILKEKLDQPHLRDLARNPMQLAILLSLIHARGSSLPDKRTALYDKYVELFFSRESDKSSTVREYRDLLIDIHRYLAWILHSESEQGHDRGSISSERLNRLLSEYLKLEGYDPSLGAKLFAGMVERVVALVSRVQGTYEFEVQPLREYFAARYLYETAPYSPTGAECKGTKPDRFDAIARNFYWLNVTRFYAGCFSKGELPGLVYLLEELAQAEDYHYTSYPRTLAAVLLSDWVFTQNQRSMREVVKLILDGLGLRSVLTIRNRHLTVSNALVLPKDCGKDELLEQCFSILRNKPPLDYAREVIELIELNAKSEEIKELWYKDVSNVVGQERTQWLEYGLYLGSLSELTVPDLTRLFSDDYNNPKRLRLVFRARQSNFCENSEEYTNIIIDSILDRDIILPSQHRTKSILRLFCQAFDSFMFTSSHAFRFPFPEQYSLNHLHRQFFSYADTREDSEDLLSTNRIFDKCIETIKLVKEEQQLPIKDWLNKLDPWDNVLEKLRTIWGERWAIFHIANVANGVNIAKEIYQDFPDLLDHSKSLCKRTCYARSKARSIDWWKKQFNTVATELDRMFVSLVFLVWASPNTILSLSEVVDPVFCQLPMEKWQHVINSMKEIVPSVRKHTHDGLFSLDIIGLPGNLSERTLSVIGMRAKREHAENLYLKYLSDYQGSDPTILEFCQETALNLAKTNPNYWQRTLEIISRSYAKGIVFDANITRISDLDTDSYSIPEEIAKEITGKPQNYPRQLVALAETKCREIVASKIVPVGEIAQRDEWFTLQ